MTCFRDESLISEPMRKTRKPKQWLSAPVALILLGFALISPVAADQQAEILTPEGTKLGALSTSGPVTDLRFVVDLQGDVPSGTYVWANLSSNKRRQRTNEGYWINWSGNLDDLIDNRFPIVDGKVIFKVLDEDLGSDNNGLTINIGYKVGGEWKFGVFPILPSTAAP